jgi:hypothetical protein
MSRIPGGRMLHDWRVRQLNMSLLERPLRRCCRCICAGRMRGSPDRRSE